MAGTLIAPALYIHVPFCVAKCPYCAFYSVPYSEDLFESYFQALTLEMEQRRTCFPARTVYIGGGSPSCLANSALKQLLEMIVRVAGSGEEFSVEVNPGQVNVEQLNLLCEAGINRLSIGVQAFDDKWLSCLGRPYSVTAIYDTIKMARAAGLINLSVDLIFALPGMGLTDWKKQLDQAIALDIPHMSAYSLTWEEQTPFKQWAQEGLLHPVSETEDQLMYEWTIDRLEAAGIHQYEISNFARPGYECRHNLVYWHNDPWIGVGPAAGSWYGGQRSMNHSDLQHYINAVMAGNNPVDEIITPNTEEQARETAVLMLRLTDGLRYKTFYGQTGFKANELFAGQISTLTEKGLLDADEQGFRLARHARVIADSVLCEFV